METKLTNEEQQVILADCLRKVLNPTGCVYTLIIAKENIVGVDVISNTNSPEEVREIIMYVLQQTNAPADGLEEIKKVQ